MSEQRIIELESRLTYQEQLLADLNEVVTQQQVELQGLGELCRSLVTRIRSLDVAPPDSDPGDERPPHY